MGKTITIEGMSCNHCTGRVEKALGGLEGVSAVVMSLENKTATVELSQPLSDEQLKATIEAAGYEVVAIENK